MLRRVLNRPCGHKGLHMVRFRDIVAACGGAALVLTGSVVHAADGAGLVVRLTHEALQRLDPIQELAALGIDGQDFRPVVDFEFGNPALAATLGLDRYYRLVLPPGIDPLPVIQALDARPDLFETVEPEHWGTTASYPNDPDFPIQWNLHNTGQGAQCGRSGGPDGHARASQHRDIGALEAWGITTGSPHVIIAIIDSGITQHIDLPPLGPGWAFDTLSTDDQCNHGTHVAGTIAAASNNQLGITGVMWSATLVSVRVLTGCNGSDVDYGRGIIWAADNAHIANSSLQYYSVGSFFTNAVEYAHQQGLIMVAAAGNYAQVVAFPARLPQVIGVGATTYEDTKATLSNAGPEVTMSAPGHQIYSLSDANRINGIGTAYRCLSGTSMASPHVAGAAGLIRSIQPSMTPGEIRRILISTAQDLGSPGWDPEFGWGRLHAGRALRLAQCYVDCDLSGDVNVSDVVCFINRFAANHPYADLNDDGKHTIDDFIQFLNMFSLGCTR
jgi:subtilisin family serine protease